MIFSLDFSLHSFDINIMLQILTKTDYGILVYIWTAYVIQRFIFDALDFLGCCKMYLGKRAQLM